MESHHFRVLLLLLLLFFVNSTEKKHYYYYYYYYSTVIHRFYRIHSILNNRFLSYDDDYDYLILPKTKVGEPDFFVFIWLNLMNVIFDKMVME